jgi:metal-dependent hydrolase (beta-lactamase superfamily II)
MASQVALVDLNLTEQSCYLFAVLGDGLAQTMKAECRRGLVHTHQHRDHRYAVTSYSSQDHASMRVLVHPDTALGAKICSTYPNFRNTKAKTHLAFDSSY